MIVANFGTKTSVRFCLGGGGGGHEAPTVVGAERENVENMEYLDRWKWHFQSLLYLTDKFKKFW